jgi:hypothetical protein
MLGKPLIAASEVLITLNDNRVTGLIGPCPKFVSQGVSYGAAGSSGSVDIAGW